MKISHSCPIVGWWEIWVIINTRYKHFSVHNFMRDLLVNQLPQDLGEFQNQYKNSNNSFGSRPIWESIYSFIERLWRPQGRENFGVSLNLQTFCRVSQWNFQLFQQFHISGEMSRATLELSLLGFLNQMWNPLF